MEYVYGTQGTMEVLKTKGDSHSDLTGYHEIKREYPDQTITDHFRVVRKVRSAEDAEGNCYDWYEIDHHYRVTDKSGAVAEEAAKRAASIEDAVCDLDDSMGARIAAIEDELCEIDIMMNGGENNE